MLGIIARCLALAAVVQSASSPYPASQFDRRRAQGRPVRGKSEHPQLVPTVPQHMLSSSYLDLQPFSHAQLWYAQEELNEVGEALHARMTLQWLYPTLVLDHSSIAHESCTGQAMFIKLDSQQAFEFVQYTWPQFTNLLFVSADFGCAKYDATSHRAYFLASNYLFDPTSNIVVLEGQYKALDEVADTAHIEWGTYTNEAPRPTAQIVARSATSVALLSSPASTTLSASNTTSVIATTTQKKQCKPKSIAASSTTLVSSSGITSAPGAPYNLTITTNSFTYPSGSSYSSSSASITAASNDPSYSASNSVSATNNFTSTSLMTQFGSSSTSSGSGASSVTPFSTINVVNNPFNATSASSILVANTTTTSMSSYVLPTGCAHPPQATISGLPAMEYCDSDFDARLDSALGLYDLGDADEADFMSALAKIAPGITNASFSDFILNPDDGDDDSNSTVLQKRHHYLKDAEHFLKKAAETVGNVVVNQVKSDVHKLEDFGKKVAGVVKKAYDFGKKVVLAVVDHVFHPHVTLKVHFPFVIPDIMHSPWGPGFEIFAYTRPYHGKGKDKEEDKADAAQKAEESESKKLPAGEKEGGNENTPEGKKGENEEKALLPDAFGEQTGFGVSLWCLDCGVDAKFGVTGAIGFSLLHGLQSGSITLEGDIYAGIFLGLDAMLTFHQELPHKRLIAVGVPGLEIPGVVVVGPEFTVDIGAFLEVDAEGQALIGIGMHIQDAVAYLDVMDSKNSYTKNWNNPTKTHNFSVEGEISATVGLALPIAISFGLDMLNGKFQKDVAIVDTPSIDFKLAIDVAWNYTTITYPNGTQETEAKPVDEIFNEGECPGITWELYLENKVDADILGLINYPLMSTTYGIDSGCVTLFYEDEETSTTSTSTHALATTTQPGAAPTQPGSAPSNQPGSAPSLYPGQSNPVGPTPTPSAQTQAGLAYWLGNLPYQFFEGYTPNGPNFDPSIFNQKASYFASGVFPDFSTFATDGSWSYNFPSIGYRPADAAMMIFQGYFNAPVTSNYTLSIPNGVDDTLYMWIDSDATSGYMTSDTSFLRQVVYNYNSLLGGTFSATAGQLIPVLIYYANVGGPGHISFQIQDSNGNVYSTTSQFFVTDAQPQFLSWPLSNTGVSFTPCTSIPGQTCAQAPIVPGNLVFNPSFEYLVHQDNGACALPSLATGWIAPNGGPAMPIGYDGSAYDGCGYGILSTTLYGGPVTYGTLVADLSPSSNYQLSFYWRVSASNAPVFSELRFFVQVTGQSDYLWSTIVRNTQTGWGQTTKTFTPQESSDQSSLQDSADVLIFGVQSFGLFGAAERVTILIDQVVVTQQSSSGKRDLVPRNTVVERDDQDDTSGSSAPSATSTGSSDAPSSQGSSDPTGIPAVDASGGSGFITGVFDSMVNTTSNGTDYSDEDQQYTYRQPGDPSLFNLSDPTIVSTPTTPSLNYSTIPDLTNTVQLHSGNDSNLYLAPVDPSDADGLFALSDGVFGGDTNNNLFVYFPNEIAAYNVSRFRLVDSNYSIPVTAQLISLSPVAPDANGNNILSAIDTLGNIFWPVACEFGDGGLSKLFLVSDPDNDTDTLLLEELRYTVTGAVVTECDPIALLAPGPLPSSLTDD